MKKMFILTSAVLVLVFTGCSYKSSKTPAVMTYDGSNLDYSTIKDMKSATVCKKLADGDGDTTIVAAAEKGEIKNIKHVDVSYTYDQFLFFQSNHRSCITVYGK